MARHLLQPSASAPIRCVELEQPASPPAGSDQTWRHLDVLACAPGSWDLVEPQCWPRVPGAVVVGRAPDGDLCCCAGFLPCGTCETCQAGLHLACRRPVRPGWNTPGGLASDVWLPAGFLAPLGIPEAAAAASVVVGLLAGAGATYQAAAMAGMAPGDTVLVLGPPGPGQLPLRLLVAMGLRPVWITGESAAAPAGVCVADVAPAADDLPSPRRHLVVLGPTPDSVDSWAPLAGACISCTLVGPAGLRPFPADLDQVLDGQITLRWARDIHPHLVLDLVAMSRSPQMDLSSAVAPCDDESMVGALEELARHAGPGWPVLEMTS